jgi:YVTN family beta-propeller protein
MSLRLLATLTAAACLLVAPAARATVVPDATSVTVGDAPEAVAAAAETAFVANAAADTISVINTRTRTRTATIALADGAQPVALAIDGTRLAVVEAGLDRLELRDTVTRASIGTVDLRLAVQTQNGTAHVGVEPRAMAVDRGRNRAYVTDGRFDRLIVVDLAALEVTARVPVGEGPRGVAVNDVGTRIYVANEEGDTLSILSAAAPAVIRSLGVGDRPWGVAVLPPGGGQVRRVIWTQRGANNVRLFDAATIEGPSPAGFTVPVGTAPTGVAVDLVTRRVWVANAGGDSVSVLEILSNGTVESAARALPGRAAGAAGDGPLAVAVEPVSSQAIVAHRVADRALVASRFDPTRHGFRFPNSFAAGLNFTIPNGVPIFGGTSVDLGSVAFGLCGGMSYGALDTFRAGSVRPPTTAVPPQSGPVFDYVFGRLVDSIPVGMLARYVDFESRPIEDVRDPLFGTLLITGTKTSSLAEVPAIRADLDEGRPVPIGLVLVSLPSPPWDNHQVLAFGRFRSGGEDVLETYDPNFPDATTFLWTESMKMTTDRAGANLAYPRVQGYFSELPAYQAKLPPWASGQVGTFKMAPKRAVARPGKRVALTVTWRHPRTWRELRSVELRLSGRHGEVGRVVFDQETGRLRARGITLDRGRSSIKGSGPAGRLVTLRVVLRPGRRLAGQTLGVQLGASDDDGATQALRPAGRLRVLRQ